MGNLFYRTRTSQPPTATANRGPTFATRTKHSRAQPTATDVESYIQELSELSEFFDGLDKLTSGEFASYKVAGEVLDLDDETMSSYLEALSMKATHLSGIRKFLNSHQTIARADLLRELLDNVEPKCRKMRDKLSRLRTSLVVAPDKHRASVGTDDEAGPSRLSHSTPTESNRPGPSGMIQPSPSGSNRPGPSGMNQPSAVRSNPRTGVSLSLPAARATDLSDSVRSDSVRSDEGEKSESEEDSESGDELSSEGQRGTARQMSSAGHGRNDATNLEGWRNENCKPDPRSIKITRSDNLLDQVVPFYAKAKSKTLRRTASVTFAGEKGFDMGALTREFFFIAFEAVISSMFKKSQIFLEGERGHLIPNAMAEPRLFTFLGRMIVHAIINECKGLPGLSPAIVHYLCSGRSLNDLEDTHPPLSIDDVADQQLKQLLQKYEKGEAFTGSEEETWVNWMSESNCQANWRSSGARHYVIQQVLIQYVFMKRVRQIQALEEGMKELGLLQFLVNNPTEENISEVFPTDDSTAYSPAAVEAIVTTRGESFDLQTFELFKQFMQDLHQKKIADYRLCNLIQFVTSSPYLPEKLVVSFDPDITIPIAHACYSEITLPLAHQTYADFRAAMVTAFQNGLTGFQLQ